MVSPWEVIVVIFAEEERKKGEKRKVRGICSQDGEKGCQGGRGDYNGERLGWCREAHGCQGRRIKDGSARL